MSERPDVPTGEPWPVPRGELPDFGHRASLIYPVQRWHDDMRQRDRIVRFMGPCVTCRRLTWAFDDGENDPRGVLGDSAYWHTDLTHRGVDYEITTCAICANDQIKYDRAQALAVQWLESKVLWAMQLRRVQR
jgi:hypothetical protein